MPNSKIDLTLGQSLVVWPEVGENGIFVDGQTHTHGDIPTINFQGINENV